MYLNTTELAVLEQLGAGLEKISLIASALKKSSKQIYRTLATLSQKKLILFQKREIEINKSTSNSLLLQLLAEFPTLKPILSNSGIMILSAVLEPQTILGIIQKTSLKKGIVYRKLQQARRMSLIKKQYLFSSLA